MEEKEERFEYTYSSKRQAEIEAIRKKYLPPSEDKLAQLKRLDKKAQKAGTSWGIALGIVGTLIFGTGMSLTMVWSEDYMIPGIIVGILGFCVLGAAYPVYKRITNKQKEKYRAEILALTEELLR